MKNSFQVFDLIPFEVNTNTQLITVSAELFIENSFEWTLDFEVSGNLEMVHWPKASSSPSRFDGLWQHTCFEAFFSSSHSSDSPYFEVNCSPSGNWNAYTFSSYRQGMSLSPDITVRLENSQFEVATARFQIKVMSLKPLALSSYALTAVIEFTDKSQSYWAISHQLEKADFHHRSGWVLIEQRA